MRHTKVMRLRILKPADGRSWKELAQLLRDVRYVVFRLANLAMSEAYLGFCMWRNGKADEFKTATIGKLSQRLRQMLTDEQQADSKRGFPPARLDQMSKNAATPSSVHDALSKYKIGALRAPSKWREVTRGKASLPTFRNNMAIPVRCDGLRKRLERTERGNVEVDLMVCLKPYPRVVLQTGDIGDGAKAVLDRLLDNQAQSLDGYRQRVFEIKHEEETNKWWLYVTYDFPAQAAPPKKEEIIVGVDLGVSCPLYAALNNGHARLGRRDFAALGARIRNLQRYVMGRRRQMQRGGRAITSSMTARSGHGRKRKLQPIEKLEGRIHRAYTTLNHQMSKAVVDFASNHGAGVIQMEDLEGLRDELTGTFLGERWRYHQLQQFIEYKGKEAGVAVRRVNPRYTSRRCSKCGAMNREFDRATRDRASSDGNVAKFKCPKCEFEVDPDYNAARNLAVIDIERLIADACSDENVVTTAL